MSAALIIRSGTRLKCTTVIWQCTSRFTLLDGDVSRIEGSHEARLRKRVLQREKLILGDRLGAGLQHRFRSDGRQVRSASVPEITFTIRFMQERPRYTRSKALRRRNTTVQVF